MQKQERVLNQLQQLAKAIVALFGRHCEVCIHRLDDLQKSLIHINGSVTGRPLGAPATDLLVKTLKKPANQIEDIYNYRTTSGDGRTLKSTTIFIRDSHDIPVYAFCINLDTTEFFNARQLLASFLTAEENELDSGPPETFSHSTGETIEALFEQAVAEMGKKPASMSTEEKTTLVQIMESYGAFQFKGAVEQVALLVGVSKYTIYNYLKKVHARQAINHLS